MSYSEAGPSNGQISHGLWIQGWIASASIPIWSRIHLCSYKVWPYAGQSQLDAKIEYSWSFNNIFDLHRSPVDRQPLMIWTLCFLCLPTLPYLAPCKYEGMDMHSFHSSLSNLGTISLKSGNLRVKMSYSEAGPSNGQISQRLIDTGLNHSASIPMWSGDQPVQLQGLTLCGSVTAGRQNWIFLKF